MMSVALYSQLDPKWGSKVIPTSQGKITMSSHGCFITSVSMALANYAVYDEPGTVLDKLIAVNGLTLDGLLSYDGLERAYPQLIYYERVYTTNDKSANLIKMQVATAIERVKKLLKLGQPVVLCVDGPDPDRNPDHAVICKDFSEGKFKIHDPNGGKDITFDERYGDPLTNLYGYVAIIGPPIGFPKDGLPGEGQSLWKLAKFRKDNGQALKKLITPNYLSEAIDSLI